MCGYPPEDLVLKPFFQDRVEAAVAALAAETDDGGPAWRWSARPGAKAASSLQRRAAACSTAARSSRLRFKVRPAQLRRVRREAGLRPGAAAGPGQLPRRAPGPADLRGHLDARRGRVPARVRRRDPDRAERLAVRGRQDRPCACKYAVARVTETGLPLVYVNQVGGQDELVFDGASFVLDADCGLAAQLPGFEEGLAVTRWRRGADGWVCDAGRGRAAHRRPGGDLPRDVLGLRDYVDKNGFPGRRPGHVGRHRFGALGGGRGRRAGRRTACTA